MKSKEKNKPKSKKKRIIILTIIILIVFVVLPTALTFILYDNTYSRKQTAEPQLRTISEFPGLEQKEVSFTSDKGQKLAGYVYTKAGLNPVGVVIIAHGLGPGGQCVYMDTADYFTSNGYLVFAYDATGNDKSEGSSIGGMAQGVIDLSHAIDYVEQDAGMKNLAVVLFGHSWGGYCVSAVLKDHPEVKAVAAVSGFNSTTGLYNADFKGNFMMVMIPYATLLEKIRFGKYADYTAMDGFDSTQAGIMIIHSQDDANVPISTGYDLYYPKYKDDSRFVFKHYDNRQHLYIFYTDAARAYIADYQAGYDAYCKEQGVTDAMKADYIKTHFDKTKAYELDQSFYGDILGFYNKNIAK